MSLFRLLPLVAGTALAFPSAQAAELLNVVPDQQLAARLEALCDGFEGEIGYFVCRLEDRAGAERRADESFPTASLIKGPILFKLAADVAAGKKSWDDVQSYDPALIDYEPGDDLVSRFQPGAKVTLSQLAGLMTGYSDNHASLWLQALVGGGAEINAWLEAHGVRATRVNSRTPGREAAKAEFGWGQTTPREMASLYGRLARPETWLDPKSGEKVLRLLSRSQLDTEALSAIPAHILVASKQGAVDRSRSEVLLAFAPTGPYVFCLITKQQRDQSYTRNNAGWELLRAASRVVWEHFSTTSGPAAAGGEKKRKP